MSNYDQQLGYRRLTDESYRDSEALSAQVDGARLAESVAPTLEDVRVLGLGGYGAQKVLLLSEGFNGIQADRMTAVGGFCAIPSYEMLNIQSGYVTSPERGDRVPLQRIAVSDAAKIATVVRMDKVLEAVGISRNPTAVVSESRLWGERLCSSLGEQGAQMDAGADEVSDIVAEADGRAFCYLANAFRLMGLDPESLKVFLDEDIMADLIRIRDELFARYGLSVEPSDSYSLIYASMYAGPYKDVLEREGYLPPAQTTAVYEPMNHASYEGGNKALFTREMLSADSLDQYLRPGGINEDMGFIAFANMMDGRGRIFRRFLPTPLLPNELNYDRFDFSVFPIVPKANGTSNVSEFTFETDPSQINLRANPLFLWAANMLPTEESLRLMQGMVEVCERYKSGRDDLKAQYKGDRASIQGAVQGLRSECRVEMADLASALEQELRRQVNILFQLP